MARRGGKRDQRKREKARASSGSPYQLIGTRGEVVSCLITGDWQKIGLADILVLRRAPGGGHALAAFLVDTACSGLKDAWGRLDISHAEFQSMIDAYPGEAGLAPTSLDEVRRIVAGGIRLAEEMGFRLPARYERWVALLGGVGDPRAADLADFGINGRWQYTGSYEDLQRRLVNGDPEAFLQRTDIEFVVGPDMLEADDESLSSEEVTEFVRKNGLEAVRKWCFANGQVPHPRLAEAWNIMTEAILATEPEPDAEEDDGNVEAVAEEATANLDALLALERPEIEAELVDALYQVRDFTAQFESPDALLEALGLTVSFEADEEDATP